MSESTWREPGDFLYEWPGTHVREMFEEPDEHELWCSCEDGGDEVWLGWDTAFRWSPHDVGDPVCPVCGRQHGVRCPQTRRDDDPIPFATSDQKALMTW